MARRLVIHTCIGGVVLFSIIRHFRALNMLHATGWIDKEDGSLQGDSARYFRSWPFFPAGSTTRLSSVQPSSSSSSFSTNIETTLSSVKSSVLSKDKLSSMSPLYKSSMPSSSSSSSSSGDQVALCTIQYENEAYLDEWVQYNLALGFSKILIYDMSLEHDLKRWKQRRSTNKRIEVIVPSNETDTTESNQLYKDCIQRLHRSSANNIEFVAFFTMNEFLVLKKHDSIGEFMMDHCPNPNCSSLLIHWQLFGSNGETAYAPLPVTKRFQYRVQDVAPRVKPISRLSALRRRQGTLRCVTRSSRFDTSDLYDTTGPDATCPTNQRRPRDVAVLNHIYTKSDREWTKGCFPTPDSIANTTNTTTGGNATQNATAPSTTTERRIEQFDCEDPALEYLKTRRNKMVFDDSSWKFLKKHIPSFEWFDQNEWIFGWNAATNNRINYFDNKNLNTGRQGLTKAKEVRKKWLEIQANQTILTVEAFMPKQEKKQKPTTPPIDKKVKPKPRPFEKKQHSRHKKRKWKWITKRKRRNKRVSK